jgi:hypothetical protein
MNSNFLLSASETAKMLQIFKKNEVQIKFESFDDFHKSLNELYPVLYESFSRNFRKHGWDSVTYEHDMSLQKITTYHKMYKYYYMNFFEKGVVDLFRHIQESMSTWKIDNACKYESNFRSYDDELTYTHNIDGTLDGYYFMVTKILCPEDNEDIINQMFYYFGYEEAKVHKIIRKKTDQYRLQYLGYNFGKRLRKISFSFNQKLFYDDEVKPYFEKYINFYKIVENIDKEIFVQFDAKNPKYIGIEINPCMPDFDNLFVYLEELVEKNILTLEQKNYIANNKKTKQAIGSFPKFRWENENTFNIKWYNRVENDELQNY